MTTKIPRKEEVECLLTIRITPTQEIWIDDTADDNKITRSEVVRYLIDKQIQWEKDMEKEGRLVEEECE
jgi:hypothetical protein